MGQSATQTGHDHILIQVEGSGHSVSVSGRPTLKLAAVRERPRVPKNDLDILIPRFEAIPFRARAAEMGLLKAWLRSGDAFSVMAVAAAGGAGKTRMAIELVRGLRTEFPEWQGGFLDHDELRQRRESIFDLRLDWDAPTLMVVDYAGSCGDSLKVLIGRLAKRVEDAEDDGQPGHPLRLLLLERHADVAQGWLYDAFDHGGSGRTAEYCQPVMEPGAFGELADRYRVVEDTVAAFSALHGGTKLAVPARGEDWDRVLGDEKFGDPLVLMMAAATAFARAESGAADPWREAARLSRADLAEKLAERERQRIGRFGVNDTERKALAHMAAFGTLCGGVARADLAGLFETELRELHYAAGSGPLAERLREAIPARAGAEWGIGPVEPDVVGEAFVLRVLRESADGVGLALRGVGYRGTAAAVLLRCLADFAGARDWVRRVESAGVLELLGAVERELPERTLVYREAAVVVGETQLRWLRAVGDAGEAGVAERARVANNLGKRLSEVGRREEALGAAEEAVRLRRDLATARPDAFLPDLAMSLNNLANRLSDLGRREEALGAAEEAVRLRRDLAKARPDAFLPDLAGSLNNLANRLSEVGRREEALGAAEEAVRHYRDLAKLRPDAFLPNLAMSLNNLAATLSDLGRREEALGAAEEAVRLYRDLAKARPDAFLPGLARSLNNLAGMLSDLGQREEALGVAEEAVRLYRDLAKARPDAFLPNLAASLNNLANMLSDLGRREEALGVAEEAVRLRRDLAKARPDAFLPNLAASLNNLANMLSDLGRREEALGVAEEAVRLRRDLAKARPDAFLPGLARSLNNLAGMLSDLGQREEALGVAEEAVRLYRDLAKARPDAFLPDLAASLNNLAAMLSAVGRREEALGVAEEAVLLYRDLAKARPDAFLPDLAMSLNNLANRLSELGQREEALGAAEDAVRLYRDLAKARPDAFLPDLARSLCVLGLRESEVGEAKRGAGRFHESLTILAPFLERYPASFAGLARAAVRDYLSCSEKAGEEPDVPLLMRLIAILAPEALQGEEEP